MPDRPNVLVTRPIMQEPLERLRERCDVTVHENEFGIPREELLQVVAGRDAIVTMLTEKVDAEFLAAARPQLKIVANHAVGFDNVDLDACTEAGVLASNTPDVLTETTADTAFALIMAAARREKLALTGGQLLSAAFQFLGELLPAPSPSSASTPSRNGLAATLKQSIADLVETDEHGRPRLTFALPDAAALDNLTHVLARLVAQTQPG